MAITLGCPGGGGVAAMCALRPGGGGGVPQSCDRHPRAWAGGGVTVWGQRSAARASPEGIMGVPHWPPWPPQPVRGVQGWPAAGGLTAMGSIRPTWSQGTASRRTQRLFGV